MESAAHLHRLRDAAIDVWREWLVVVHKPRRLAIVKERDEHRKRISRANANLAARLDFSLALRKNGSIACWGGVEDQDSPDGIQGDFVMVAAGHSHTLALQCDGNIACWGSNGDGRAPPDGMQGDFVAIAAGHFHSLALQRDGSIACWGRNYDGQAPTPENDEEDGEDNYATLSANFPFMTDVHIL